MHGFYVTNIFLFYSILFTRFLLNVLIQLICKKVLNRLNGGMIMRRHLFLYLASCALVLGSLSFARSINADEVTPDSVATSTVETTQVNTQEESKPKVTYDSANYLSSNLKIIKLKAGTDLYKDEALTKVDHHAKKGSHYLTTKLTQNADGQPVVKTSSGLYIPAKKSLMVKVKGYQNPKGYHQVHYTQIKPYGKVGYNLSYGYEGIKTWKVMHRVGTWAGSVFYNSATVNAVRNFQSSHGLKPTGTVDVKTWTKMGFSKKSWYDIDSYVAPLKAKAWEGRKAHIEAMIKQAYKYMGKPWLAGSSSSPAYGLDCSGLVMQALYAGGISPVPTSSIGHAHPGNEWNSRNLWADKKLKTVPYSQRQRGDLVFYYQPGTTTIWHVAIYLGNNMVIESWPPQVMVQPIVNGQRNVIAGIKRPFI